MLQFWKKTSQGKNCPESLSINAKEHKFSPNYQTKSTSETCEELAEKFLEDGVHYTKCKSQLCKTLEEVLLDKNALLHFIQFMESRNAEAYILCWLDIEALKCDTYLKLSTSPTDTNNTEHDSLSISNDSDSVTSNNSNEFSITSLSEGKTSSSGKSISICDKEIGDISLSPKLNQEKYILNKKRLEEYALLIFKKYIALESNLSIHCTEEIRNDVIESICDSTKLLSGSCFDKVQNFVYIVMEDNYFKTFLSSDHFCKYQIDILTSGNVVLDDILHNENGLFYFMEFLDQENHRNLLEFWLAATNFHQHLQNQGELFDANEAQSDAVVLYDKYFSLQAHYPLGLGNKVRLSIEQTICGENGVGIDCFDVPLKIVEKILDTCFLTQFLESQLYYKFLSELINTVQANGYATNKQKHKRTHSDLDSEHSGSSLFLGFDLNKQNNNKRTTKTADMTIDTRELYDPDTLWKQKRKSKLVCGFVNELGKFETEFEPEPERGEFNIKDVVKKLVSLEEEQKRKEEMAWQVAEMIVRDITNLTLSGQKY